MPAILRFEYKGGEILSESEGRLASFQHKWPCAIASSRGAAPGMGERRGIKAICLTRPIVPVLLMLLISVGLVSCRGTYSQDNMVLYRDLGLRIPIIGQGSGEVRDLTRFFMRTHASARESDVKRIAKFYISEAAIEGVNHDVAFCQMCLETNYLRFGGDVGRWQNNFCGLGATGGQACGASFETVQLGVRAHIQHLKAYAGTTPLNRPVVDPRFSHVRRGSAPYVQDLTGKWATDPQYGLKIRRKLQALAQCL